MLLQVSMLMYPPFAKLIKTFEVNLRFIYVL